MISEPIASSDPGAPDAVREDPPSAGDSRGRCLPPGSLLEQYQIQRVLSTSGFSAVYLAKDLSTDEQVAIKEYLPTRLVDHLEPSQAILRGAALATAYKRGKFAFLSEAETLSRCNHPALVRVDRILDLHDTLYRVMPCYYGKTVEALRQSSKVGMDEVTLRRLVEGLLDALTALHAADCVHGAVSPRKILWLADDRPLLMDFSAVRRGILSPDVQRRMALAEAGYQAPEQVQPRPPDWIPGPWSDVYSVGAVAYFCMVGEAPTRQGREMLLEKVTQLQKQKRLPRYNPALLKLLLQSLAERPQDRPQTPAEFRRLLDETGQPATELSQGQSEASKKGQVGPQAVKPSGGATPVGQGDRSPGPVEPSQADVHGGGAAPPPDGARSSLSQGARAWVVAAMASIVLGVGLVAWNFDRQHQDQAVLAGISEPAVAEVPAEPAPPETQMEAPEAPPPAEVAEGSVPSELAPPAAPSAPPEPAGEALTGAAPAELVVPPPAAGKAADPSHVSRAKEPASPIEACGRRTEFALYKCVKKQCSDKQWSAHPQCVRLRATDEVVP